jgi:hypothetical protein
MLKQFLILAVSLALCLPCFGANEIQIFWLDSETGRAKTGENNVYAVVRQLSTGYTWQTTLTSYVAEPNSWGECAIALTEDTFHDGIYKGDFPQTSPRGTYGVFVYQGETPATTDRVVAAYEMDWYGGAEIGQTGAIQVLVAALGGYTARVNASSTDSVGLAALYPAAGDVVDLTGHVLIPLTGDKVGTRFVISGWSGAASTGTANFVAGSGTVSTANTEVLIVPGWLHTAMEWYQNAWRFTRKAGEQIDGSRF